MGRLNPYALVQKKVAKDVESKRKAARQAKFDESRGVSITQTQVFRPSRVAGL